MTCPCDRCDGCGELADSDAQEPWTAWTTLPFQPIAVQMGWIKPIPCPDCDGTGALYAEELG